MKNKNDLNLEPSLLNLEPSPRSGRFVPPEAGEVAAYAKAEGLDNHAECFCDHFASNGWRVGGKAPMRDWRAAYRNWCRRAPAFGAPKVASGNKRVVELAAEYRAACVAGNDAGKREVLQKVKTEGLEWAVVREEVIRQNEKTAE